MVGLLLSNCTKKEAPPIGEVPTYESLTKQQKVSPPESSPESYNGTTISNETIFSLDLPAEESVKVFSEESEKQPQKEDWAHWKLYGRSSPPFFAIFFDFDDYNIRKDMWDKIKANVKYLLEHPSIKIQLQGNCDERGTNEYNMALGAKRALEVKKVLVKLGVNKDRIFTISFGEEKPLAKCHNETCWAINRRVDFVIIN